MNRRQIKIGEENRRNVRMLLAHYPGISRAEIAELLDLSPMAVTRHVAAIRSEWGGKTLPTRRGRIASPNPEMTHD